MTGHEGLAFSGQDQTELTFSAQELSDFVALIGSCSSTRPDEMMRRLMLTRAGVRPEAMRVSVPYDHESISRELALTATGIWYFGGALLAALQIAGADEGDRAVLDRWLDRKEKANDRMALLRIAAKVREFPFDPKSQVEAPPADSDGT
ncbi:hypothetical protein [Burkholderia gladioli]|uniref:hypothetical protein n=1 Tax=Burkholderia gladioli TaxID=28095 RepID=UPI00163F58D1|nr:hypothetical protein [Burkholderia gladioli]